MRRVHIKQAEDIYDVMYPIFIISKILGLAPFQYNRKGQKSYTAHFGVITILRYILILGVMCYICFVMDDINFSVNIGGMALRYELYFGTIMTAIILLLAITNQKLLIDAIHKITEIDEDFKNMGREVTYKNAQIFSYLQILFMISMFSCKAILQPFSNDLAYFVIYSIFNVIDFINTGMLFQFVDLLLLIRQRFIWINREIRNLTSFSRKISTIGETVEINQLMQVHPKNSDFKSVIKSLGKIQNKLYFVCKVTNRNYGMQLLVTVTIRFIMITTQLINTYKVIQDPRLAGSVTHSLIAIYLFFNFTKLFMVCALSTNTAAKVSGILGEI